MLIAPASALADFSITNFTASPASAPAGSHPDSTVHMEFGGGVTEDVKDIIQHFPGGIIPNPEALPKCPKAQFALGSCPANSRLGSTTLVASSDTLPGVNVSVNGDVYNLEVDPPFAGGLGFIVAGSPLAAPFTVRSATFGAIPSLGFTDPPGLTTSLPDEEADIDNQPIMPTRRDYGLTGISVNVPRNLDLGLGLDNIKIRSIEYTLDGTPATAFMCGTDLCPYLTTTTACVQGLPMLEATEYDLPATTTVDESKIKVNRLGNVLTGTSCDELHLPYSPSLGVTPGTSRTETPTSYDVSINVPAGEFQGADNDRHEPYLKRSSITLPDGTALSPPAAQGLVGCTDDQLGIGNQKPPDCPGGDIGDVTVESKNVPDDLHGDFYLRTPTPGHNFRVFIAFKIVDGLWIKLDGESFPDPVTGQVTTVFDDLPMLPFEKFTIKLRGGDRAVLVNPPACDSHTSTSTLTPWSGATTFPSSRDKHPSDSFVTTYDGASAGCPDPFPFNPTVAGSTDPVQAGANTNLLLTLSNPDRDQLLRTLGTSLPPGLVGRLTGIPLCSLNSAAAGSCDDSSRIGTVGATVGSGNDPLPLPGSIYLAQPLQAGDPASLSIVVPAKAGPFDFGNVIVRARIVVRRDVGLDVALVDDLPRIIEGVPIRLRATDVKIDRPSFMRNPTSCAQLQFGASFTSVLGAQANATAPFQVTGCAALPFSPKLRFEVSGEMKKDGHPQLKATLTQPAGQANIAKSRVVLPGVIKPEVAALQRPGVLCPEAKAATRSCPSTSQVGTAKAVTPLLPEPLAGPVYIVQHSGNPLPKLVVFLDGRVSIQLEAQNELQGLRIVNRFDSLPDVPVSSFELTIFGGKNGILKNGENLCEKENRGDVTFTAHSGKVFSDHPLVETPLDVPGCVSTAAPKVSIALRGVRSGRPVLTMRVRRGSSGANMRKLSLKLPRSLRTAVRKARKGVVVRAARKLRRSQWTLSRKGVLTVKRLPSRGVASITAVLGKGVLKPTASLRRKTRAHKRPKVKFTLRVTDVQSRHFTIRRKLRAR